MITAHATTVVIEVPIPQLKRGEDLVVPRSFNYFRFIQLIHTCKASSGFITLNGTIRSLLCILI